MAGQTSSNLKSSNTVTLANLGWLGLGIVAFGLSVLSLNPPSDIMGVADSPLRTAFLYEWELLVELPLLIFLMYKVTRIEKFRAPPGRYVEGRHYPIFSTYILAMIAMVAALDVTTGFINTVTNFDLASAIEAFFAAFGGPVVAFVGIFIGDIIRFSVGAMPYTTVSEVVGQAITQGGRMAYVGFIIFYFVRTQKRPVMSWLTWVIILPLAIVIQAMSILMNFFVRGPWTWMLGNVGFMVFWFPTTAISVIVGLVVAEAAYRRAAWRRGPQASGTPAPS